MLVKCMGNEMNYVLENETLMVTISTHGAELRSIKDKGSEQEYLWNGDETYWKRCSPILFPLVGNYKNKQCKYEGKTYTLFQHGFARDMEFSLADKKKNEIWFGLRSNEATLELYPFVFTLEIGYRLTENKIKVMWRVKNKDSKTMYFSIGGHPAFLCPLKEGEKQSDYYISFDCKEELEYSLVNEEGLLAYEGNKLTLDDGKLKIEEDLFDQDALVIENYQARRVSLMTPEKEPYITVDFFAPLFGLWSPAKKHAPFICIEPWYGRSDREDFEGTLEEREWGNKLEPKEIFEAEYMITVE